MAKRLPAFEAVPTRELRALDAADLPPGTVALAKFLLGKVLVHDGDDGRITGRIVETEAYPPGDEACHARSGRTARNASLFLAHGHVYVYRAYGISMMLNISSEAEGNGAGVLIRAVEPLTGIDVMRRRRGIDDIYRLTGPSFRHRSQARRSSVCRGERAVAGG
jgi:DNA-3-methyladenine glycosylase